MLLAPVKSEPGWETAGVSVAAAQEGLYINHLVKDELVLGPELLQPPDVAYTIKALSSTEKHTNPQNAIKPCSVKLMRLPIKIEDINLKTDIISTEDILGTEIDVATNESTDTDFKLTVRPCSVKLVLMPDIEQGFSSHIYTKSPLVDTRRIVSPHAIAGKNTNPQIDKNLYSIKEDILDNETPVSSNGKTEIDSPVRHCSEQERMFGNAGRGTRNLGERTIKLWSGDSYENVDLKEDIMLSDIIKQFERQAQYTLLKNTANINKFAKKVTSESTINAVNEELPDNSKAPELNNAEKEPVATSKHDDLKPNKRNLSILPDYKCDNCGGRFKNKSKLKIHILNFLLGYSCDQQVDKKRFQCSCGYKTNKKSTFQVHQMRHRSEKCYKCSYCTYACIDIYALSIHEMNHTREMRFECGHCNFKTHNKRNLATHMPIHTIGKQFKCSQCDYATRHSCALNVHRRTHTGEKPYECSHCDYKCKQYGHLRAHERRHLGYKPFKCNVCDYKCSDKYRLKKHMRTHTGEKPYKCSFCDFKCSRNSHLMTHERRHTGEKPFKCSFCDYACNQKPNLIAHERVHTGQKPFKCKFCHYSTAQKSHLTTHLKIHTGDKPFKCNDCDYECSCKSSLICHLRIHSDEKPYKCSICDYKCRQRGSLQVHQRVHSGEKPYRCNRCDFSCKYKDSFNRHVKKHHGGKA